MNLDIARTGLLTAHRSLDRAAADVARASVASQAGAGDTGAPAAVPAPAPVPASVQAEIEALPGAMLSLMAASNAVLANLQSVRRTEEAFDALLRTG
jgi:hypothetical protein